MQVRGYYRLFLMLFSLPTSVFAMASHFTLHTSHFSLPSLTSITILYYSSTSCYYFSFPIICSDFSHPTLTSHFSLLTMTSRFCISLFLFAVSPRSPLTSLFNFWLPHSRFQLLTSNFSILNSHRLLISFFLLWLLTSHFSLFASYFSLLLWFPIFFLQRILATHFPVSAIISNFPLLVFDFSPPTSHSTPNSY